LNQLSANGSGDFHLERIKKKRIELSHRLRRSRTPKNVRENWRGTGCV
jgi:hypothetical protein